MSAMLQQPPAIFARLVARPSSLCCVPSRRRVPLPAIGQLRTCMSVCASEQQQQQQHAPRGRRMLLGCDGVRVAVPGRRPLQQQRRQQGLVIGPSRLFATSSACRAVNGDPGDRNRNQTPQPKKPLLEKTKELRNQLKSLKTHEKIWNVPNVLTFSRLIAAPVVGYLVLHDQHAWALGLFAYAGITDLVDGWIARRWQLQTVIGSVVDPMADKLLMAITVGCLAAKGALPGPLAILIFGRDASLAIAAIYYRYASLPSPKTFARYWDFSLPSAEVHPTTVSKFNTFLQLALIGLTLLFPVLAHSSDTGEGHRVIDAASDKLAPAEVGAVSTDSAGSPLTASSASNPTSGADPASTISLESQQHESRQSTYTSALYAATDAGTLSTAVTALQILVGATTVWSGFSYAFLKDAVTILGSNEALKKKQGARGRAIIGLTFALVCISATGWAIRGKQRREEESQEMKNE